MTSWMDGAGKALRTVVAPGTTVGKTLRAGKDAARVFRDGVRVRTPAPEPVREGPGLTDYTEWLALQPELQPLPDAPATDFLVVIEAPAQARDDDAAVRATADSVRSQGSARARTVVVTTGTPMREALDGATEGFVLFLRAGSVLRPHALEQIAKQYRVDPVLVLVAFDADTLTADGERIAPRFRPAWSPEMLLGANYLGRAFAIRSELARSVPSGAVDDHGVWRLLLAGEFAEDTVGLVPHVLLSEPAGAAAEVRDADAAMVAAVLTARGEPARAAVVNGVVRVRFEPTEWPAVSIVVPSRHSRTNLERLLTSLVTTEYPAFDVTVVDNGGESDENEEWYATLQPGFPLRHVWWTEEPFNYSRVNTVTARETTGEVLVFLNDDTEIVDPGWLSELVGLLLRDGMGTVGFQHRTQDGLVQHAGVMIGPGGFAANLFAGLDPDDDTLMGPVRWYRDSLAVTGACVGVRREHFEEVGGFDERFQLTGSDVVLGLDQVIRGRRNAVIPFDAVRHFESLTRGAHAPRADSFASYWRYQPWIAGGDPYISPNVSRLTAVPRFAAPDDPSPLELALAGLGRPFTSSAQQQSTISEDATSLLPIADISADEVAAVIESHRATSGRREIGTVNWLLPGFDLPFFGGVNTALRIADKLRRDHGVENRFFVNGHPNDEFYSSAIAAAFPALADSPVTNYYGTDEGLAAIPPADAAIATFWLTARDVAKTPGTPRKFYLVQDYEPSFYPASTMFAMTEQTYRLGLYGICNTRSMHDIYAGGYGGTATYFSPAVDRGIFHPEGRPSKAEDEPLTIFAYARDHFRNCWELVFAALSEIKKRHGDGVRIVAAGAKYLPPSADFLDLGLLDYRATGRLYRATDIGVTMQISRHPSYLPLELMASGVAMVVPDSPWFRWLFRPGDNARTTMMTVSEVVAGIEQLIVDARVRRSIAAAGTETIDRAHSDWDAALDGIYEFLADPEAAAIPTSAPEWVAP